MEEKIKQDENKKKIGLLIFASILILTGVFSLLANLFNLNRIGFVFLPSLGILFIIWGFLIKEDGLFIPGGIILGIGLGNFFVNEILLEDLSGLLRGGAYLVFFSIGWVLIPILIKINSKKTELWPLIPGGIMALIGSILLMGEKGLNLLKIASIIWPFVLIIAGILIAFYSLNPKK